jgi:hypothetical protein
MRLDWTRRFQSSHGVLRMQVASSMCSGVVLSAPARTPQWLRPLAVLKKSRNDHETIVNYVFRDVGDRLYQGVLYIQNAVRFGGTRVHVISCILLRKCGLPCADFCETDGVTALPADLVTYTVSVGRADGSFFTPQSIVWLSRHRISRMLQELNFYGRIVYRILSKTDRSVENGGGGFFLSTS